MYKELIEKAIEARDNSYSPYSKFKVGAAVATASGKIYSGCNVESASYGATVCAERVAACKAVSEGDRDIKAIAIVGSSNYTFPCGICRQFLVEFGEDIEVIVANSSDDFKVCSLKELLPHSFGPSDLSE